MSMPPLQRKRLSLEKREANLVEWQRHARRLRGGAVKADWDQIPDMAAETIAIPRSAAEQAIKILTEHSVTLWELGSLDRVCGRAEHYRPRD